MLMEKPLVDVLFNVIVVKSNFFFFSEFWLGHKLLSFGNNYFGQSSAYNYFNILNGHKLYLIF